jgi:long-subunit fatty acid transport protein
MTAHTWSNQFGSFEDRDVPFVPVPAFSFGMFIDPSKELEIANLFKMGDWGLHDQPDPDDPGPIDEEEELLGGRVRVGFGIFPVTGGKIQMKKMRTPGFTNGVDWEVDTLSLAITPGIAFRVTRHLSIGLNAQFHYSKFELDGGIAQPRFLLSDDFEFAAVLINNRPQIITSADLDDAFTYGASWRAGVMFNTDLPGLGEGAGVALGLVYQDRSYSADYLGRATVDGTDEVNNLTQGNPGLLRIVDARIDPARGFASVYDLRVQEYESPRSAGLGVAFRPHRRFSIGLDYTYLGWRENKKTFKVRLSNGNNPNLDVMTQPSIPVRVPLNFRDQHVLAVGVSGLVAEGADLVEGVPAWSLLLRAGFNHARSPAPRNTTLPQLPVITENHVSAGLSFLWGPLVELSLAFEYALPKTYEVGPHVGDFTLSSSKQEVEILFFQLGLGFNF